MFVNKEPGTSFAVTLQLPSPASRIQSTYLTGPGLTSKTGISIQNASISLSAGLGSMSPKYDIAANGSSAIVYVPALTAVLVETS